MHKQDTPKHVYIIIGTIFFSLLFGSWQGWAYAVSEEKKKQVKEEDKCGVMCGGGGGFWAGRCFAVNACIRIRKTKTEWADVDEAKAWFAYNCRLATRMHIIFVVYFFIFLFRTAYTYAQYVHVHRKKTNNDGIEKYFSESIFRYCLCAFLLFNARYLLLRVLLFFLELFFFYFRLRSREAHSVQQQKKKNKCEWRNIRSTTNAPHR